jgi:hypothetical protein
MNNIIDVTWTDIKTFYSDRSLSLQYLETSAQYHIFAFDDKFGMYATIRKTDPVVDPSDQKDFEDNHKALANQSLTDESNRILVRNVAAKKGWTYLAHPIECTTSKLDGCYASDWSGTARGNISMKFYNSSDVELVAETQAELDANCVKTVITFNPDYDYEIVSGNIHQHTTPTSNIRVWVVGGTIDNNGLPWEYPTGTFNVGEFVGGINLKYIGDQDQIETDGRASKYMKKTITGVPYNANQMQVIIRHPVGEQSDIMLVLEYFKA